MSLNGEETHFIALNLGVWIRVDLPIWTAVRTLTVAVVCVVLCSSHLSFQLVRG